MAVASLLARAALQKVAEWEWFDVRLLVFDVLEQVGTVGIAVAIGVGLTTVSETENALPEPTSERLQEVMTRFNGLDTLLRELASEVREMTEESTVLEQRARDAQVLLQLSQEEKSALLHEWDRRDRASSKRDLLLFAAGLVAGALTNLFIG